MIRDLVSKNDPILREEMPAFDFMNKSLDPVELYNDLAETMIANEGLGLSANQIGVRCRAFVIRAENVIGVFNPKIVDISSEMVYLEEGCLSFPNLFVKIKRPRSVKVRYTNPDGQTETRTFDGMTARVFQHELDHLNGICHTQRANRFHLEQAKKLAKKMDRRGRPISKLDLLSPEAAQVLEALKS